MSHLFDENIATSSVEEGLDFACSLASDAIAQMGEAGQGSAPGLLRELTSYIQFRYVGELLLAAECLAALGRACDSEAFRSVQFWSQMRWVVSQMSLSSEDLARLAIPGS